MGNMHIVTGYRGENHVAAADVGSFNASIFGTGQYVLDRGSKFATTTVSNNKIRVADGDLMIQGRHVRLNENTYVDLTIENGAQGYLRNDLIVARYTKDSNSGVEDCNLVVIKGTAAASNPVDPEYTSGDIINDHVLIADMPLYRVPLDGLNVGTLVQLFDMATIIKPHASTHAKGGIDAITPALIGASNKTHAGQHASGGADPITPESIGASNKTHASQHASDGSDPITPDEIGAIPDTDKGVASGVATLDSNGKVVADQATSARGTNITASRSLTEDDNGKLLLAYSANVTITVPSGLPLGMEVEVCRWGTGTVTFAAGNGVSIRSVNSALSIANQYGCAVLKKVTTDDIWILSGDLV